MNVGEKLAGFMMNIGDKELFYATDKKNVTDRIAHTFIDVIGNIKDADPELIIRCKTDKATMKDIKKRIDNATLELVDTGKVKFYKLETRFMSERIPYDESNCLVIFY